MEEYIDNVAERINEPGAKTIGSMDEFRSADTYKESPGKYLSQKI